MKKFVLYTTLFILIIILCVSAYNVVNILNEYSTASNYYAEIRTSATSNELAQSSDASHSAQSSKAAHTTTINHKKLLKINKDYIGWLMVPGTKIDYPVVSCDNNSFYLNHGFKKDTLTSGSLFLDSRCDLSSDFNNIIYGHHMRDGSMFGELEKLRNTDFLKNHPTIMFYSADGVVYTYKIFSVHLVTEDSDWFVQTTNKKDFHKYFKKAVKASEFNSETTYIGEKMLTLSTCAYDFNGARLLVHGML